MPQKLKKINNTTYGASFSNRTKVEIGDRGNKHFIPSCMMSCFDDEVVLKVTYADRPYNMLTDIPLEFDEEENEYIAPDELDKLILTEAVHYPPYEIGIWYDAGDLLEYNGGLYEVVQGHTSQEDWPPDTTSALYKTSTPPGVIAGWVQPEGAHDAYNLGDKVLFEDKIYKSLIDANVWSPTDYPAGWEETDGQVDVECYSLEPTKQYKYGGFEFEIILRSKPVSNIINMSIETKNLEFYYQPEKIGMEQPENVIGSYAVYHSLCGNTHRERLAEKYKCGKAFHIFRPKVIDANDDWIWGELDIDVENGILGITINQNWLNNAVYPVRVDPTFGYDELGIYLSDITNIIKGSVFEVDLYEGITGGTVTSITAGIENDRAKFKYAIYDSATGNLIDTSVENLDKSTFSLQWETLNLNAESIQDTDYVLVAWAGKDIPPPIISADQLDSDIKVLWTYNPAEALMAYDDGVAEQGVSQEKKYNTFPSVADFGYDFSYDNKKYSIYCTYEEVEVDDAIYGVRIDTTNDHPSTAVSYTDDAVGFSPMSGNDGVFQWGSWQDIWESIGIRPCLFKEGAVNYYLDPSDFSKKEDGVTDADITSGADGDVMIEFPKIYWKMERVGDYLDVKYSLVEHTGFQCLAHTRDDGEGSVRVRDYVYMSAYGGYVDANDKLRSLSGQTLTVDFTHPAGTGYAQNNNGVGYEGYEMFPFYGQLMLQVLYTVWFKSLDSQTALGRGLVEAGAKVNSGGTNNKGMFYGSTNVEEQIKFCGVEDLWGNLLWWVDGLYSNSARKLWIATDKFEVVPYDLDGTTMIDKDPRPDNWFEYGDGFASNLLGYITDVHGDTTTGFVMTQGGGGLSTYYCDYGYLYASRLGCFGGHWGFGSGAGVFSLWVTRSGAGALSYAGSRSWFCQK